MALDGSVKADMTLKGLISWLETKDPNEGYEFTSTTNCALMQYLKANGDTRHYHEVPEFNALTTFPRCPTMVKAVLSYPRTFGTALAKARAMVQEGEVV